MKHDRGHGPGLFLLVLAVSLLFFRPAARAERLTQGEREWLDRKGEVVFVSETAYPPFEFVDGEGNRRGMCIELVQWMATELGFKAALRDTTFKGAQEAVLSGKADALTGIFYSEERERLFDFTSMTWEVPALIFVRADRFDIGDLEDLRGKRIALQRGDYAAEFLRSRGIDYEPVLTANFGEAADRVIGGEADALIGDLQVVLYHLYSRDLARQAKSVGEPLYVGRNGMGVREGERLLASILDKGLALARERGVLERITRKWLGTRYAREAPWMYRHARHLAVALLSVGLLALVALLWNFHLKRVVGRRTRELKEKTSRLEESEARFRELANLLPQTVFEADGEGRLVYANLFGARAFGLAEEDFRKGLYARELIVAEDRQRAERNIGRLLAGEEVLEEKYTALRKDGTRFPVIVHASPVRREGKVTGFRGSVIDVTEMEKVQEALRRSEERYRSLVESSSDAIVMLDPRRRIVSCNKAFLDLFGYAEDEVVGGSARKIHPSDESFEAFGKRAYLTMGEKGFHLTEWSFMRKDGSFVHAEAVNSAIKNPDGTLRGYVGILRDVGERRKLEAQLRQAQKMEAIGTLAGGVAHDFNNLLQAILGYAQILTTGRDKDDPDTKRLKAIEETARRASDLTRRLLTFGRKVESRLKPVDLNRLVRQVEDLLKRTIPKMVDIELRLGQGLWIVEGDPGQIEQVLVNLAVNARDAMPRGGRLVVETRNAVLDEEYCRARPETAPGEYVLLSVSDTGHGMDRKTLEHVFEPFFTTKEAGKGTGLGLAMVYGIVKGHKGHVSCRSEPGKGSSFEILLPVSPSKASCAPLEEETEEELPRGGENILLVEDEAALRELGTQMLEQAGYVVFPAGSGEKALEIYREKGSEIHLVLLALIMPGMGGKACLEALAELNPRVKAVVASGYSADGWTGSGVGPAVKAFIQKPYSLGTMLRAVRKALDE